MANDSKLNFLNRFLSSLNLGDGVLFGMNDVPYVFYGASMLMESDRRRQEVLALVGDRALSLAMALYGAEARQPSSAIQNNTSRFLCSSNLAASYVAAGFSTYASVAADVSTGSPKVGSRMFEAMVGALFNIRGMHAVETILKRIMSENWAVLDVSDDSSGSMSSGTGVFLSLT